MGTLRFYDSAHHFMWQEKSDPMLDIVQSIAIKATQPPQGYRGDPAFVIYESDDKIEVQFYIIVSRPGIYGVTLAHLTDEIDEEE